METEKVKIDEVNDPMPAVPKPHRHLIKLGVGFFVILLLFVAGAYYYLQYYSKPKAVVVVKEVTPTVAQAKGALQLKEQVSFADITTGEDLDIKNWPQALAKLVLADPKALKEQKVTYEGGGQGFVASYSVDQPLVNAHRSILSSFYPLDTKNGTQVNTQRANKFGFVEVENNTYQIRVDFEFVEDSKTLVDVKVKIK
jgi:hypothetical protein